MSNQNSYHKKPVISVVIPVKNGSATIRECLNSIYSQTMASQLEVIVIDSGSSDKTLQILHFEQVARKYPLRIVKIDPKNFNHGETRNLGASMAQGQFVVFTVQDAKAADNMWLEKMLVHFEDELVSGVCGQQIVEHQPDKNPLQWFRPAGEADVFKIQFDDFNSLEGKEQQQYCNWDNVTAMYRRSTLQEIPFQKVSFSEDALWAKDALTKQKTLVYDYNARVYHYHHQSFSYNFKRNYIIQFFLYNNFNYSKPAKSFPVEIAKIFYRISKIPFTFRNRLKWLFYNLNIELSKTAVLILFKIIVLTSGSKGVDRGLEVFCKTIPQGRQQ